MYLFSDSVFSVSIARRVQDPLAELVKIEPKHIGVGMYQVKQLDHLIYEIHQYKEQYSSWIGEVGSSFQRFYVCGRVIRS